MKTFDPISQAYSNMPTPEPGKVVVAFLGDSAQVVTANPGGNLLSKYKRLADPRVIGAVIAGLVLLVLVFGAWFVLTVTVLLSAAFIFILGNRQSAIAKTILGPAPSYYLVDRSQHEIIDTRRVQLQNTGVFAKIDFEYMVTVRDPVGVVLAGVRDVREHLSHTIYTEVAKLASEGSLDDKLLKLRRGLNSLSESLPSGGLFEISNLTFEVHAEGKIAGEFEKIAEQDVRIQGIDAEHKVMEQERIYYEGLIQSEGKLLAEMMRPDADRKIVEAALRARVERSEVDYNQKLALLKTAMDQGIIEPHHIERDYPQFMTGLMETLSDLTGGAAGVRRLEADKGNGEPDEADFQAQSDGDEAPTETNKPDSKDS